MFRWKRASKVIFFLQGRMWKVLFKSLKQKMYHLSEADSCHELGRLDTWFLQNLTLSPFVDAVNKVMRDNGLHTCIQKFWDPYLHIKCTFFSSCCLHTCYTQNSTAYEMLYIKGPLKEKNKIPQKYLDSTGWNLRLFCFKMQRFKSQTFGG